MATIRLAKISRTIDVIDVVNLTAVLAVVTIYSNEENINFAILATSCTILAIRDIFTFRISFLSLLSISILAIAECGWDFLTIGQKVATVIVILSSVIFLGELAKRWSRRRCMASGDVWLMASAGLWVEPVEIGPWLLLVGCSGLAHVAIRNAKRPAWSPHVRIPAGAHVVLAMMMLKSFPNSILLLLGVVA